MAQPSRWRSDGAGPFQVSLTVAGQWRICTAFPNIPRPLVIVSFETARAAVRPDVESIALERFRVPGAALTDRGLAGERSGRRLRDAASRGRGVEPGAPGAGIDT